MKRTPLQRKARQVRPGEVRNCEVCGKPFRGKHEHRNYQQQFCSNACRAEARALGRRAEWPDRDTMLRLVNDERLSDAAIGRLYGHSYEWSRLVRKHYEIDAVPKPPFRAIRHGRYVGLGGFTVKAKGEDTCRNCGARPTGRGPLGALHLHHVIPRSMCKATRGDLRNGIPLCRRCHAGWHERTVVIPRSVFTDEEWNFLVSAPVWGQNVRVWLDNNYPANAVIWS